MTLSTKIILRALTLLGFLALPWTLAPYPMQVMVMVGIFAILTVSLNLTSGFGGMISLGHAGFFLVGAYTAALMSVDLGLNPWIGIATSLVITGAFGLFLGVPALKLSGHFLAVITIAFGLIMHVLAINLEGLTGGIGGVPNIPRPEIFGYVLRSDRDFYYLVLAALLGTLVVLREILTSEFGRALMAIRDDEIAAACTGIDVRRMKILTFVLSAAVAGLAGALYAHYVRYINPDSFTIDISIRIFIMMIIGGIGSLAGSLLGTLAVYTLPEALRFLNEYYYLVFGLLVIIVMLFLPGGLASLGGIAVTRLRRILATEPRLS